MSAQLKQLRQGDVLLTRITEPQEKIQSTGPDGIGEGLRVEGERTGHFHHLPGQMFDVGENRRAILLRETATLTHQEHAHIEVPPGWWEVRLQREWVPSTRRQTRRWD